MPRRPRRRVAAPGAAPRAGIPAAVGGRGRVGARLGAGVGGVVLRCERPWAQAWREACEAPAAWAALHDGPRHSTERVPAGARSRLLSPMSIHPRFAAMDVRPITPRLLPP